MFSPISPIIVWVTKEAYSNEGRASRVDFIKPESFEGSMPEFLSLPSQDVAAQFWRRLRGLHFRNLHMLGIPVGPLGWPKPIKNPYPQTFTDNSRSLVYRLYNPLEKTWEQTQAIAQFYFLGKPA